MTHDITDFTPAERADLCDAIRKHFGAHKNPAYIAKHIECFDDGGRTMLGAAFKSQEARLDDFMAGYLAGVSDTDNQNASDASDEVQ